MSSLNLVYRLGLPLGLVMTLDSVVLTAQIVAIDVAVLLRLKDMLLRVTTLDRTCTTRT